ncbi:hypothetical protein [Streptomyces griseofuscus]|uniref:Uncharacterized protein n=1 Tax=Streptomyces griseofuscus TaxID=146922 RepID=A0A426RZ95_9ACTN|nr:hypothetical protein [Streptomyces griseofuscus]RRQ81589.1 hypothetical protein CQW44_30800 [Streptomyces griseofuscus]
MDRQLILDLYEWAPGICFRHPECGEIPTALVAVLHPRGNGEHEVRACRCCVIAIEDARREMAARQGQAYIPGEIGARE